MPKQFTGGSLLLPLQIDGYTFDPVNYVGSVDHRISTQLKDQLPDFILNDYPTFVSFLDAYYEWMEQYQNPRAEAVRLKTYADIDDTLDQFIQYFRSELVYNLPLDLTSGINEKNLIKRITDLQKTKGSRKSFELLFRILFNTTIDFDFPKDRVLKLSTSTFNDKKYLRIAPVIDLDVAKNLEGTLVVQRSKTGGPINATALINTITFSYGNGVDFFSLELENVSGTFNEIRPVELEPNGLTGGRYFANVFPTLSSMKINAGGSGYQLNDVLTVTDTNGTVILRGLVDNISPIGGIRGFNYIENFGIYTGPQGLTYAIETSTGSGANLEGESQAVLSPGPDTYDDDAGKLSGRSFIQDGFLFQDFSYIIRVNKRLEEFSDAVKSLVHPAGTIMFSEFISEIGMTATGSIETDLIGHYTPIIGHFLPHTFGTTIDPRGFTYDGTHYDFYPRGYNGQDGRTAGDFINSVWSSITYGTPHLNPSNGITHDPYKLYTSTGSQIPFDGFESSRNLLNGALGSTGYFGLTQDDQGEYVGLYGFFPVGSSRTNTLTYPGFGLTHYGGYVSPQETFTDTGFSGGQVTFVSGTDSSTADYWIVHRHVNSMGIENLGTTGSNPILRIPISPTQNKNTIYSPVVSSIDGYSLQTAKGFTLTEGFYSVGEIVRQTRPRESQAIGRVLAIEASAYTNRTPNDKGDPFYNIGVDYVTLEVLNGSFTKEEDITKVRRPLVGDTSGTSRFIDKSFSESIHTIGQQVYDTSWMEVPINIVVNKIQFSYFQS